MNAYKIEKELESMKQGFTRVIAGEVVTRWNQDRFEIGSWGKETMCLQTAAQILANSNPEAK